MRTTRAVGSAVVAFLVSIGTRASAAPTARLVYSRTADAASCPDEAALRRAVSRRVGYDAFFPWAPRTVIVGIVRRQGAFVATVSLVDEAGIDHGAHELHSDAPCDDLLDTVALAVAIAIDPQSLLAIPAPAKEPRPSPEDPRPLSLPSPSPALEAAPTPIVVRAPRPLARRVRLEASLGGVVSLAMAPAVSVGTTLGLGIHVSRFSLAIEGTVDAPASEAVRAGARASAWLAYGAVVPCGYVGPLFGCVVAQVGSLESVGQGVADGRSTSNAWWALGGRVGALLPVTDHVLLRFRLDVVGDLRPTTLTLDAEPAWKAPVVAGLLGIDALVRF